MKYGKYVVLVLLIFLFMPFIVKAESTGTTSAIVTMRTEPISTSSDELLEHSIQSGQTVTIIELVDSKDSSTDLCPSKKWYHATYNNVTGYLCSSYVTENGASDVTPTDPTELYSKNVCRSGSIIDIASVKANYNYEVELAKFPDSYKSYIEALHSAHPNWIFYADVLKDKTGNTLKFSDAVAGEQSNSAIYKSNDSSDGYNSFLDTSTNHYNWNTNTWTIYGDSGEWYYASKNAIAYYMDVRNFLNERNIFMFQDSRYYSNNTKNIASDILSNGNMTTFNVGTNTYSYVDAFMDAAGCSLVSPNMLIARVRVETGNGTSSVVSGTYSTVNGLTSDGINLNGYYNYFNVRAYAYEPYTAKQYGLLYAKEVGWTNRYKAIVEGSNFLANSYVYNNQPTQFYQKYNLNPSNKDNLYIHQYMTNFQAPFTESDKVYWGYKDTNNMDNVLVFNIPVYDASTLPATVSPLPHNGNPNNWLSSLSINGKSISSFDGDNYYSYDDNYDGVADYTYDNNIYNYTIPYNLSIINIGYTTPVTTSTVSGAGDISLSLTDKNFAINVVVTAQNGTTKTYRLNITRDAAPETDENGNIIYPTISKILANVGVKYDDEYMSGLVIGTSQKSLQETIQKQSSLIGVSVSSNSNNKTSSLATGDIIKIVSGTTTTQFQYVLYGDSNGDGSINILDLMAVRRVILNQSNLTGANLKAVDATKDGTVNILDLMAVRKQILDYNIEQ